MARVQMQLYDLSLELMLGDLTREDNCDCIVSTAGKDLQLDAAGPLAAAVLQAAGPGIQTECTQQLEAFRMEKVILTGAGGMGCRHVIHVQSTRHKIKWMERIRKALGLANNAGCANIAFPALGGGRGLGCEEMALVFYEALSGWCVSGESGAFPALRTIKFIFIQREVLETYVSCLEFALDPQSQYLPMEEMEASGNDSSDRSSADPEEADTHPQRSAAQAGASRMTDTLDTFACKICLDIMKPPVLLCVHCAQLIGCGACVNTLLGSNHSHCPYCRHDWSGGGVQEVKGLDDFLTNLRLHDQ